jgi:undecaprenyl-diphosphatase
MGDISKSDALLIGFSQILAFIPGTSRSGITITAGLFIGLDRKTAVKFSFFMSAPIILAASLYEISNLFQSGDDINIFNFITTVLFSIMSSLFAIHFFLKFLDKFGVIPFVIYRLILGAVLLYFFI